MPRSLVIALVALIVLALGTGAVLAALSLNNGGDGESASIETAAADAPITESEQDGDEDLDVDLGPLLPELEDLLAEEGFFEDLEESLFSEELLGEPEDGSNEKAKEPFVGITLADEEGEVVILGVARGSPAARDGLEEGDVIVALEDSTVQGPDDVAGIVGDSEKGDVLTFLVRRGGEELEIEVRVAERPAQSRRFDHAPGRLLPDGALRGLLGSGSLGSRLDQFIEAEIAFLDDEGERKNLRLIAGTLAEVSDDRIVVTPNGGGETREFGITDDTRIFEPFRAGAEELKEGDRVLVVAAGEGREASAIVGLPAGQGEAPD